MIDRYAHGSIPRGEGASWAKLTDEAVREIRQAALTAKQKEIALAYGLTQSMVSRIVRRKRWTHI